MPDNLENNTSLANPEYVTQPVTVDSTSGILIFSRILLTISSVILIVNLLMHAYVALEIGKTNDPGGFGIGIFFLFFNFATVPITFLLSIVTLSRALAKSAKIAFYTCLASISLIVLTIILSTKFG